MGKRSNFERKEFDFYPTPLQAVIPLFPHVSGSFIEPCAGDGRLIRHLEQNGLTCAYACDLEPKGEGIEKRDVLFFDSSFPEADLIITNPPWDRKSLHEMIGMFRHHAPTWLLFDSDWMFTGQAKPHLKFCQKIVSIGRVSWMENGQAGMDNCCWYLFGKEESETIFLP